MKYAEIKKYYNTVELIKTAISPDSKYIAFGFDLHNNEEISFMIKNITDDCIVGVKGW
jgi:protease II